jgi:hypothetical protein
MLVFFEQNLVFLAVPKTGTSAVEWALRPKADIIFGKGRKHTTGMRYRKKIAPFLQDTYGITPKPFAVMRNPVEQIRSWFRYRQGVSETNSDRSTQGHSFDEFVLAVIEDDPPVYAAIGSQYNFLTSARGKLLVAHLFAYEAQPLFRNFLMDQFGDDLKFKQKNVSPNADTSLSPDVEAKLRAARSKEFELYDRLMAADGHLRNPRA